MSSDGGIAAYAGEDDRPSGQKVLLEQLIFIGKIVGYVAYMAASFGGGYLAIRWAFSHGLSSDWQQLIAYGTGLVGVIFGAVGVYMLFTVTRIYGANATLDDKIVFRTDLSKTERALRWMIDAYGWIGCTLLLAAIGVWFG